MDAKQQGSDGHSGQDPSTDHAGASEESRRAGVRRTAGIAALLCAVMLGFGYAMVPLYDLLCDLTGFGGRIVSETEAERIADAEALLARPVKLRLTATAGSVGTFDFAAPTNRIELQTGELVDLRYSVTNKTSSRIVGQAIPSVVPAEATRYVKKIECFCFDQQVLEPQVETGLPVRLYVDKRLPEGIGEITLSYVYYDSSEQNPDLLEMDHSMH